MIVLMRSQKKPNWRMTKYFKEIQILLRPVTKNEMLTFLMGRYEYGQDIKIIAKEHRRGHHAAVAILKKAEKEMPCMADYFKHKKKGSIMSHKLLVANILKQIVIDWNYTDKNGSKPYKPYRLAIRKFLKSEWFMVLCDLLDINPQILSEKIITGKLPENEFDKRYIGRI